MAHSLLFFSNWNLYQVSNWLKKTNSIKYCQTNAVQ